MVVIDAHKHKLDYKRSEKEQGIAELKKKYQTHYDPVTGTIKEGGAATLLSRRKQDLRVPERQGAGRIDPETGKVTYKQSGRTYLDPKTGKVTPATEKVKLMAELDDVSTLSSGTQQEEAYANYANRMKALANTARKEYLATGRLQYSPDAATTYKPEVDSLKSKLNIAQLNAPRERRAIAIANSRIKAIQQDNPDIDKKELKKIKQVAITDARAAVGASGRDTKINITDREWEAIQAGAISDSKLTQILRYADEKVVRERATPRSATQLSTAQINKIKNMRNMGYTTAEIADSLGKSSSTISKYLNA
jgi:hypothetical protein